MSKNNLAVAFLAVVAVIASGNSAFAVCEGALVIATNNSSSDVRTDWRLADLVDRATYETTKHDGGAHATIYGIPMGANYDDFKETVTKFKHERNESLSTSQLINMATTGLDPNSPNAYRDCLNNSVFLADGLHGAIVSATKSDITILVKWFDPGAPHNAEVTWSPASIEGETLQKLIPAGLTTLRVLRPKFQLSLSGNFNGYTTGAIILEPLPPTMASLPPSKPMLADQIENGSRFTVSFGLIKGGHLGTIYQNRSLDGTYTKGTRTWRTSGPNSADGHFVDVSYCPVGCPGVSPNPLQPSQYQLELWGAALTFDELGNVFYNSEKVGVVKVQ